MPRLQKMQVLAGLYDIFDGFAAGLDLACGKGCSACCTVNVTLTTLEGRYLLSSLDQARRQVVAAQLAAEKYRPRLLPLVTVNGMADRLAAGRDIPEEVACPAWGACPLLEDGLCPLYPARPFACRCMVSRRCCSATGVADMDDFTITVSTVFQQGIENLDRGGGFGNLSDVLAKLIARGTEPGHPVQSAVLEKSTLLTNKPLAVLMVPPKHRRRLAPLLERISALAG